MFFSPLNHFEPIQIGIFQIGKSIFSFDSISFTILLTFALLHGFVFFSLYHKPFFPSKLNVIFDYLIATLYPIFNEKPFKTYRSLIPFFFIYFFNFIFF